MFALVASPAAADVVVVSVYDASTSAASDRAQNTAMLRRALARPSPRIASDVSVDATLVSLTVDATTPTVRVAARVRLAISDDTGRLLSVITGNAKLESERTDRPHALRRLRDDAVTAAVDCTIAKLRLALRQVGS